MHADTEMTSVPTPDDDTALLLMLAYVEAECRRLGAEAAATHVAKAAALVTGAKQEPWQRRVH